MTFSVKEIDFNDDKVCTRLVIADKFDKVVFNWTGNELKETPQKPEPEAANTQESEAENPNMKILKDFCNQKLKDENTDQLQLGSFYRFYSRKIQDGWKGRITPEILWERWMSIAY
jgi:hypothetical protein